MDSNIYILHSGRGGACTRDKTKLPMQELEQGGLMHKGGVFAGFYGICTVLLMPCSPAQGEKCQVSSNVVIVS